ncbi:hypothetical protein ACU4GD_33070 [Cupriavidus basilensis]
MPSEWFQAFEGKRFVAARMELVSGEGADRARRDLREWIDGPILVGSHVLGGGAGILRLDHPAGRLLAISRDRRWLS